MTDTPHTIGLTPERLEAELKGPTVKAMDTLLEEGAALVVVIDREGLVRVATGGGLSPETVADLLTDVAAGVTEAEPVRR